MTERFVILSIKINSRYDTVIEFYSEFQFKTYEDAKAAINEKEMPKGSFIIQSVFIKN